MTVDDLIAALQALPPEQRKLPVELSVAYDSGYAGAESDIFAIEVGEVYDAPEDEDDRLMVYQAIQLVGDQDGFAKWLQRRARVVDLVALGSRAAEPRAYLQQREGLPSMLVVDGKPVAIVRRIIPQQQPPALPPGHRAPAPSEHVELERDPDYTPVGFSI